MTALDGGSLPEPGEVGQERDGEPEGLEVGIDVVGGHGASGLHAGAVDLEAVLGRDAGVGFGPNDVGGKLALLGGGQLGGRGELERAPGGPTRELLLGRGLEDGQEPRQGARSG